MITILSQLIGQVESNNNPAATRHEPAYNRTAPWMAKLMKANPGWSQDTYQMFGSTSFGKYQIMGDNIYGLGYVGTLRDFWATEAIQDAYFALFCQSRGIMYTLQEVLTDQTKRENFAHHYNGPGNIAVYSQRILDTYAAHKNG